MATGSEDAAYNSGGIFSKALIDGLQGEADFTRTGVIMFSGCHLRKNDSRKAVVVIRETAKA